MATSVLRNVFLNNRAEQYPADVLDQFVIPIHFHTLDMRNDRKSVVILGGRGSGKTMFIRYFCHQTVFSKNRKSVSDKELQNIGLYWKPDIMFCRFLDKDWFEDQEKQKIFKHYLSLNILYDFSKALYTISKADLVGGSLDLLSHAIPASIESYFNRKTKKLADLEIFIEEQLTALDLWINNGSSPPPKFISFSYIIERICDSLAKTEPRLKEVFFRIFVDEFENLTNSQQKYINDFIRSPGERFSVNIAKRRYSDTTKDTSGFEKITDIHDFRVIDLESHFHEDNTGLGNFTLFAAEILVFRLIQNGIKFPNLNYDLSILKNEAKLPDRHAQAYQAEIKSLARNILPQLSTREICELVMSDKALKRRWQKQIEIGLKKHQSQINFSEFISSSSPEASIVAACLVNRDTNRFSPEIILDELHKINYQDQQSKFSGDGGWIQNNLYGQLLYLYIGVRSKPNPLYAGFERFCILARGNLRFFQELCHQSFIIFESENFSLDDDELTTTIPIETQSLAAALTADKILTEIEHLGSLGPTLKLLIHRLGKIFELSQKRLTCPQHLVQL